MTTYTGTADANGDFTIPFSRNYTSGQKVTVKALKDGAEKSIELFAPSDVLGGGAIQFGGNLTNFPVNIGNITLTDQISGVVQANAMRANVNADNLFYTASGLIINGAISEIKDYAFADWRKAKLLTLPESLLKIGKNTFSGFGSSSTSEFDIKLPNSVVTLSDYSFEYAGMKNFDIGIGVTSIPTYCFQYTSKLVSFNFRNVKNIANNAFYGSNLQTINIPNSMEMIGLGCFQNVKAVEINTGNGITNIPAFAFSGCTACLKFIIGSNITNIDSNGISQLNSCNELICLPFNPPSLNTSALNNLKSTCVIKVPSASLSTYQTAANWSTHASKMIGV